MEREWRPGQQVMVISPKEGVRAHWGQIVYCELLAEKQICCRVGTVRPGGVRGEKSY